MFGSVSKTIKFQSTETYLIVSLKAKDQINEKQLQFLNESKDKGFLSLRWEKNAAGNKLRYDISNLVVCSEYIKQPRTLEEYFGLIYQFQQMMDFCEKSYLQSGCLVVSETKDVYCDPKTKRLYAAFLPLLDSHCNCSHPVHFLRDLHKHSNLIVTDSSLLDRYQMFLNAPLHGQKPNAPMSDFSVAEQLLGFLRENGLVPDEKAVAETAVSSVQQSDEASEQKKTVDDNQPYLTDAEQNQILIDHFPFTIGRKRSNDLVIPITTVSGFHATILERNGKYYIQDNHSGNGTYLNNKDVQKAGDSELHTGDVIYIYNIPLRFTAPMAERREIFKEQDAPLYSPETTDLSKYLEQMEKDDTAEYSENQPRRASEFIESEVPAMSSEPELAEAQSDEESNLAEHSGFNGNIAYLINNATKEHLPIYEYPFTCSELMEMRILQETFGEHHETVVENINCDELTVEGRELGENERIRIFSGGTFIYHGIPYSFYVES